MRALNGHGPKASEFNKYWQGGKLGYKGVHYNIGPSPSNLKLNLAVEHEYVTTPIWNVIGIINGTLQDEVVVLGNHRDAWITGGAIDPNSGSTALNELIRSFGAALKLGWKPFRTIVFGSWDGEEYAVIGSTEWVEEYMPWLADSAIAYLNVDVGIRGPAFASSASPLLNKILYEATAAIQSPNQTIPGQTVGDIWSGDIETLGSGSDYTAFQHFAGIPSIDMGFGGSDPNLESPVYHYHSNYDSFAWMEKFGDQGWHYHVTMTKVWALLVAALVEKPIIAFNVTDYACGLKTYLESVKATISRSDDPMVQSLSFPTLEHAIARLYNESKAFDARADDLATSIIGGIPWWKWWQRARLYFDVKEVNKKYKYFERKFLYADGLDGRPQFKHTIFAPGIWTGYAGVTFPGLTESIIRGDVLGIKVSSVLNRPISLMTDDELIQRWTEIIKDRVNEATEWLN